jgi:hypothetical protein
VRSFTFNDNNKFVACCSRSTLCSAAVASPTTARQACECGLQIRTESSVQRIAGLHADIETLATLHELGMPLSYILVNAAALSGRMPVLQHLLVEQLCPAPVALTYFAARSGSISMLNWLRTEGQCVFDQNTCDGAAAGGHLALLQHLRREGCDWHEEYVTSFAASSGSIEVVEWLRQQGVEIGFWVLLWAALAGQTAMCEHLRSIGCDWEAGACTHATFNGHFDTLRWLREHGCPWDVRDVCMSAARCGYTNVLEYVIEQGEVLGAELLTEALNCAGAHNQLRAAQWLRQHGAQWPAALSHVEEYDNGDEADPIQWSGDMITWARAEGCTSPTSL